MVKLILYQLLLTSTLILSKPYYGEINTPVTDIESPENANQYLNGPVKLTKSFSSIPRGFLQNKLSPLLYLDKTSSTNTNNSVRNILKRLNPSSIISKTIGKINNIQDQFPLNGRNSPISFKLFSFEPNKSNTDFNGNGVYTSNVYQSSGLCCITNKCITLKSGEQCNYETVLGSNNQNSEKQQMSFNKPFNSANDVKQINSNGKENFNVKPTGLNEKQMKNLRNQVLQVSNNYRKKHRITPLVLDENLNNYAQDWANSIAKTGSLQHREDHIYGENLYASSSPKNLGKSAVDSWYNEIKYYNANANEKELYANTAIHHMTQLLWKSSKKLGVGISNGKNGMYNVVANYDPVGNIGNNFKTNLPTITQNYINKVKG